MSALDVMNDQIIDRIRVHQRWFRMKRRHFDKMNKHELLFWLSGFQGRFRVAVSYLTKKDKPKDICVFHEEADCEKYIYPRDLYSTNENEPCHEECFEKYGDKTRDQIEDPDGDCYDTVINQKEETSF